MVIPPSGKETIMNKQKHLNLEARILIETMLNEQIPETNVPSEPSYVIKTDDPTIFDNFTNEDLAYPRNMNVPPIPEKPLRVFFLPPCPDQKPTELLLFRTPPTMALRSMT